MIGIDDVGTLTTVGTAIQQAISLGKFLKELGETEVIAAHFDANGERISGSSDIEIQRITMKGREDVWYFMVGEVPGYTFVRAPVIDSVAVELPATRQGEKNADANIWRWVSTRLPGVIYSGEDPPNLRVEFVVVGYRTEAVIKHLT